MIVFSLALAERPRIEVDALYEVVLLDANATHGALRVVHGYQAREFPPEPPKDCGYAGMKAHPTAGVDLYVVELATGALERFTVYAATQQAIPTTERTLSPCTPFETSRQQLDRAKARMAAVGLDPTRLPEERPLSATPLQGRVTSELDEEQMLRAYTWTVSHDAKPVYTGTWAFSPNMAGTSSHVEHGAWTAGAGQVLLDHWRWSNMRGSGHALGLTPVLPSPPSRRSDP